jgi:hypothetical protein
MAKSSDQKSSDQKTEKNKKRRRLKFELLPGPRGVVLSSGSPRFREGAAFMMLSACTTADSIHPPNMTFSMNPARVLKNVHVHLIFWGSAWAGNLNALAGQITDAVQNMLSGPYMTYLAQYGVGRGSLHRTTFVTDRGEPPNVVTDSDGNPIGTGFTDQDVFNFLIQLLDDSDTTHVPEPDERFPLFYCVIMPPTATYFDTKNPPNKNNTVGANAGFTWRDTDLGDVDNDPLTVAWIGNDGTLDYVTQVLSHELVETCTDPDNGQGIVQITPTCPPPPPPPPAPATSQSCQIGDPCTGTCDRVNGVSVQGYWSEADKRCITPNWYSVRRTLFGRDFSQGIKHSLQPNTPIPSLKSLVASLF